MEYSRTRQQLAVIGGWGRLARALERKGFRRQRSGGITVYRSPKHDCEIMKVDGNIIDTLLGTVRLVISYTPPVKWSLTGRRKFSIAELEEILDTFLSEE